MTKIGKKGFLKRLIARFYHFLFRSFKKEKIYEKQLKSFPTGFLFITRVF